MQAVAAAHFGGSPPAKAAGAGSSQGTFVELADVVDNKVCTRFPPEPSGFLHMGHAKASMLNNYFAHEKYDGQLILRFDDTNPSKEKDEFVEAIKADVATLGIQYDRCTHTSDSFDMIEKYQVELLQKGLAYVDDTPQEQMQKERFDGLCGKW